MAYIFGQNSRKKFFQFHRTFRLQQTVRMEFRHYGIDLVSSNEILSVNETVLYIAVKCWCSCRLKCISTCDILLCCVLIDEIIFNEFKVIDEF